MRQVIRLLAAAALVLALPGSAHAASSANVRQVAQLPELKSAISINFIDDAMFVSTAAGLFSYDVADPAQPKLLGALPEYIWENEDMDVDPVRKRVFISRDPRGFTSPAAPGSTFPFGALEIIDVSDPANMQRLNVVPLEAGHTSTCVNRCDYIWTGGPGTSLTTQPSEWDGRPIFATDVRDPANPKPCPAPIDTERNDGKTDYAHDVQVDAAGVAWVSGGGGVRGYWTEGTHRDPVTGETREATPCAPVPYGGSGTPDTATPSRFMHNAWRDAAPEPAPAAPAPAEGAAAPPTPAPAAKPAARKRKHPKRRARTCAKRRRTASRRRTTRACRRAAKRRAAKRRAARRKSRRTAARRRLAQADPALRRSDVLLGTEENIVSDCATSGRFVAYDIRGTLGGEGFRPGSREGHRMTALDTWTPEGQEGSTGCASAHYFSSRGDGITANAFYEQGVRFLDTSDPTDIRQVGYYVNSDANTWAAYWHKGRVYVADFQRGVEVLEFDGGPGAAPVRAPAVARSRRSGFSKRLFGGLCPVDAAAPRPAAR